MKTGTIISKVLPPEDIQANSSAYRTMKIEKEKIKRLRKSPDVRNMYCLRIGTAEFYFVTEAKMNYFWKGDKHSKGHRDKLIELRGQEYVDNLKVETFKK